MMENIKLLDRLISLAAEESGTSGCATPLITAKDRPPRPRYAIDCGSRASSAGSSRSASTRAYGGRCAGTWTQAVDSHVRSGEYQN